MTTVSDPTLTPELALAYLGELSTDIRAAAVLDKRGLVAAHSGFDNGDAEQIGALVGHLFDHAREATADGPAPAQVEVALPDGIVFALRERGFTVAVVAGRYALSSLMFFDLRMVARDLAGTGKATAS